MRVDIAALIIVFFSGSQNGKLIYEKVLKRDKNLKGMQSRTVLLILTVFKIILHIFYHSYMQLVVRLHFIVA